jgi:hypothetical protein
MDGLVKVFLKIDVVKIYKKAEPIIYYTKNKLPIITIQDNRTEQHLKQIHDYINGVVYSKDNVNGLLAIPKIDFNNFYTTPLYGELMKQKKYEDINKPLCKWFKYANKRQYLDNLENLRFLNTLF